MKISRRIRHFSIATIHDFLEDRCFAMAAALAYYALFAMPALLFAAVYVAGTVYGQDVAEGRLQTQLNSVLGVSVASAVQAMIIGTRNGARRETLTALTVFGSLTYSVLSAAYELQQSLNQAWDVRLDESRSRSFVLKRICSVLLIIFCMIFLIASLTTVPTLSTVKGQHSSIRASVLRIFEIFVFWSGCAVFLAIIMKILPDAEIEWRDVWLGASVTSALIFIGVYLIRMYLNHTNVNDAYGAIGSIAALLLWAYYCSAILMLGVEFTRVWAREHGRQIQPERGAVRVAVIERPTRAM